MARKRSRSRGSSKQPDEAAAVNKKDLERFAGSSDEEGGHNSEVEEDEQQLVQQMEKKKRQAEGKLKNSKPKRADDDEDEGDNDDDDEQNHDDDDELNEEDGVPERDDDEEAAGENDSSDSEGDDEELSSRMAGMANAMTRILGTKAAGTQSIVLSKTKTPLQKIAEQEKQKERDMKEKRKLNRERHLTALHEPLSVATTSVRVVAPGSTSSIAKELDQERTHRRVATRGVVALFNAIAQHQKKPSDGGAQEQPTAKSLQVKKMTKHGFLDMIKAKAASAAPTDAKKTKAGADSGKQQWSALSDDFMLNPKKNWDQETSEEEEEEEVEEGWSDDEKIEKTKVKKQKVGAF